MIKGKRNTDLIICPYCGYEEPDSSEYNNDDTEFTCPECENTCFLEVEYTPRYTTMPDCEANDLEHKWTDKCEGRPAVGKPLASDPNYIYCICSECGSTEYILKSELLMGGGNDK